MRTICILFLLAIACLCCRLTRLPRSSLTGTLIGTVKDAQGGVLPGAVVRVELAGADWRTADADDEREGAAALPGSPSRICTCSTSSSRDSRAYHEEDIRIGAGATIERTAVLNVAGIAESFVVEGAGSRIEARGSGFETRFGPEDLKAIPARRFSMFDFIRAAPGVSPTSPGKRLDQQRVRVRLRHEREHVPHRRHELHLPVQRRGAIRAGRRLHSGSASPVGGRVRRVRQHAGRRRSTSSPGREATVFCTTRRTTRRPPP